MSVMEPGTEFGGYRIERLLGAGGFCNVYLAEDLRPALRRKVALKVLNPTLSADDKNRERFQRESLLAVELDEHPNIVGVFDAGEQDGQLFIAQRYVDGRDLGKVIEEDGPLTPTRAVEVLLEIAGALDAAHEAGLVHRDVKPRNILIRDRDQRCFLADFGLTKRTASSDSLTGAGEFLGTFAYAAPEQLGGQAVDGRADIYALGCVLFESLTGMAPFTGDIHSMITSHLTKPPPRLSQTRPGLPPAIDEVIDTAMAKEPADRYQTGHAFAEAARRALLTSGLPPPVVPMPPPPPGPPTVSAPVATPPPPASPVPAPAPAPTANLLTPAPPGAQPPPPGPSGPGGGRSRLPLVLGGAAVIVALIIGGVLVLGGDDGGSSDDESTTTTIDQEAADLAAAEDAADEAFGALPPALAAACELGDVEENDRGVVANISCEPSQGADEVRVIVFEDDDDVDEAFAEAESAAGEELATDADCKTARYAVHSWTTVDDPDGVAGQVACYLDGSGNAGLAWTDANASWTAVARRSDDGDAALYEWWSDLVDRLDPADTEDFPNPAEAQLLTHVPDDLRDSCVRAELRPQETASVQCSPASGAASVFYNQYPNAQGAAAEYQSLLATAEVDRNAGDENECPFEGTLTVGSETAGRVFCGLQPDGDAFMAWISRPLAVQSEATIAPGATVAQFWDWWTTAGPS
jgi:serine/threonine protein kinase